MSYLEAQSVHFSPNYLTRSNHLKGYFSKGFSGGGGGMPPDPPVLLAYQLAAPLLKKIEGKRCQQRLIRCIGLLLCVSLEYRHSSSGRHASKGWTMGDCQQGRHPGSSVYPPQDSGPLRNPFLNPCDAIIFIVFFHPFDGSHLRLECLWLNRGSNPANVSQTYLQYILEWIDVCRHSWHSLK